MGRTFRAYCVSAAQRLCVSLSARQTLRPMQETAGAAPSSARMRRGFSSTSLRRGLAELIITTPMLLPASARRFRFMMAIGSAVARLVTGSHARKGRL